MKLVRHGPPGGEKPGLLLADGSRRDVSGVVADYDEAFFTGEGLRRLAEAVAGREALLPGVPASARWGAPVARPSKIVCVGLNYADHAAESNSPLPAEPVLFMKATTALCGPYDDLRLPRGAHCADYEVELAVVIGRLARDVPEADAPAHLAGYCLNNDVSERSFQKERGGQWVKGKSADTFCPLGPFLATPEEIPDPHALRLWSRVNGELRQDGNTADLIFKVPFLVHYISQFMTLLPGDVISTGTPAGVAMATGRYLRPGDLVEWGADELGEARHTVRAPNPG
jgi:2-keto-4-pentenoate hydratase/2-oxohepta-3-ene-1,7-dioic acid hydratase in catechol pathway